MKPRHKLMKKMRETVLKDAGQDGWKAQPGESAYYANTCRCGFAALTSLVMVVGNENKNIRPCMDTVSVQCPSCCRVLALPSFPSELIAKAFLQRFGLALKKEGL